MPSGMAPPSTSPFAMACIQRCAPITGNRSLCVTPPFFSSSSTCALTALRMTRLESPYERPISTVSRSVDWMNFSLSAGCSGDSCVSMNRVPMLMPSAPSARAATSPRPSAKPPQATTGIFRRDTAAGMSTRPGTSSSPGCPGAFETVDAHCIDAEAFRLQGMTHGDALVQDPSRRPA